MKRRKLLQAMGCSALVLPLLAAPAASVAAPPQRAPGMHDTTLGWQLTKGQVVNPGVTSTLPQGTLTTGYIVEATVQSIDQTTPVRRGTFHIELDAFSPNRDLPGQTAGLWYVRGDWHITANNASAKEKKARHSPSRVAGALSAELPFNPATTAGSMSTSVLLPRAPQGGRWTSGEGSFSGNEIFEGLMRIDAQIWPDVQSAR